MKIAISGKGGVGKTMLAALLSKIFADSGYSVLAVDADPDVNLATTLGFIPYDQALPEADLANRPLLDASQQISVGVRDIYQALLSTVQLQSILN